MSGETLEQIARTFFSIDERMDELSALASTPEEHAQLRGARDAARDTYWAAVAKRLEDNNPMVASTRASLATANEKLSEEIGKMESFAAIINAISSAVRLAAALVTMAGV